MFAAVLQGLGGSSLVVNAAHLSFIADSSPISPRPSALRSIVVASIIGGIAPPFIGLRLVSVENYAAVFGIATACWAGYLFYLTLVLRETRSPTPLLSWNADATTTGDDITIVLGSIVRVTRWIIDSITSAFNQVFSEETSRWLVAVPFLMLIFERLFGEQNGGGPVHIMSTNVMPNPTKVSYRSRSS